MNRIIVIVIFSLTVFPLITIANTSFYIQAHQDDWQLFVGASAVRDINSGDKVVFIYTTAGNGQRPNPEVYWKARELAAIDSTEFAADTTSTECTSVTVNLHTIKRCSSGNTISYFMRLVSGDITRLRELISAADTIDDSTQYGDWGDFHLTIQKLILAESAGQSGQVWVNAPEFCTCLLGNTNLDHIDTGRAVFYATQGFNWGRVWFLDYVIKDKPINTSVDDYMSKVSTFMIYDRSMQENYVVNGDGQSTYCESSQSPGLYSSWLLREYRRFDSGNSPIGCSPCPSSS